jgi:hypothetical protein
MNTENSNMSALSLANVEALAQNEGEATGLGSSRKTGG